MKKELTIMGQQVTLAMNLGVQIAFEDIAGKNFNPNEIESTKDTVCLYMAVIAANNPDTSIKIEQLMTDMTFDEQKQLNAAIGELIADWYHVPANEAAKIQGGGKQKNAKRP